MTTSYHKMSRTEQLNFIADNTKVPLKELHQLVFNETRNNQIENYLTDYVIPEGIAVNLVVNGRKYLVPMVTEEPSVIAAASFGSKIINLAGGLKAKSQRLMTGQILINEKVEPVKNFIQRHETEILKIANQAHPSMQRRGGGAKSLRTRILTDNKMSLDILVDTKEAMGANTINTMMEAVGSYLRQNNITVEMAILSNLMDDALTLATCKIPFQLIGKEVAEKIAVASDFAQLDPYRAATHNKGIMNGIDAVVMATGNDFRAIESGAHAFAAQNGQYRGLSQWQIDGKYLVGKIQLPMPIATVGGSIGINSLAQMNLKILGNPQSKELAEIIAALGLAQNLAALRALVSEGIQKGHMKLQAKSLLLACGATADELPMAVAKLLGKSIDSKNAKQVLTDIRKKD